jgi:hypothetical protein
VLGGLMALTMYNLTICISASEVIGG